MGGLGPGIGGFEILVVGLVALIVVGPKDLPMLMRKVGQFMARARSMANEFRASFDEMARQSELDELRKEVDALRRGTGMVPLGAEAEAAFRDIRTDLERPLDAPQPALKTPEGETAPQPLAPAVPAPQAEPVLAEPVLAEPVPAKPSRRPRAAKADGGDPVKPRAASKPKPKSKPAAARRKAVEP